MYGKWRWDPSQWRHNSVIKGGNSDVKGRGLCDTTTSQTNNKWLRCIAVELKTYIKKAHSLHPNQPLGGPLTLLALSAVLQTPSSSDHCPWHPPPTEAKLIQYIKEKRSDTAPGLKLVLLKSCRKIPIWTDHPNILYISQVTAFGYMTSCDFNLC